MTLVEMPKAVLTAGPEPIVKKWCSHVIIATTQMNSVAATIER